MPAAAAAMPARCATALTSRVSIASARGRAARGVVLRTPSLRAAPGRRARLPCSASSGGESDTSKKETIDRLERMLGMESEKEEEELPPPPPKQETVTPTVVKSEPKKQRTGTTYDWILEDFEEDGKPDVANRSLASVSYLLPLLDGLHYGRYLFMQVPQLSLALLPLFPAISVFEQARWLQIVAFFGLALGVANNRNMPTFTRFNAQQAILLDILQIVPDLLLGNKGPAPGNDFLIQATIIASNTVFIYVYLCCLAGAVASLNGKAVRLPLLGSAAESQANR